MNTVEVIGLVVGGVALAIYGLDRIGHAIENSVAKEISNVRMSTGAHVPNGMMGLGVKEVAHDWAICGDCGKSYHIDTGHVCALEDSIAYAARMGFHSMAAPPIPVRVEGDCNLCRSPIVCSRHGCAYNSGDATRALETAQAQPVVITEFEVHNDVAEFSAPSTKLELVPGKKA